MRIVYILLAICSLAACKKDSNGQLSANGSNGKQVGASARDLLSGGTFKSIKIEIDYMTGAKPTDNTVANLKSFISGLVNKSGGIEVLLSEIPAQNKSMYSISDIQSLEKTHRSQFNTSDAVGTYFLFVDGGFTQANVLGVAYLNTSMCIFEKTIQDNSGGLFMPSTEKLETTVVEHEFGHIFGLVDIGSPMQTNHKDTQNGNHCTNTACLMYFQVETTDAIANLVNSPVPTLDQNCRADLKANGGK